MNHCYKQTFKFGCPKLIRATSSSSAVPPVNVQFSASFYNTGEGSPTVAVCVNAGPLSGRVIQVTVTATPGTAQG